jgi:hypothetical protein
MLPRRRLLFALPALVFARPGFAVYPAVERGRCPFASRLLTAEK